MVNTSVTRRECVGVLILNDGAEANRTGCGTLVGVTVRQSTLENSIGSTIVDQDLRQIEVQSRRAVRQAILSTIIGSIDFGLIDHQCLTAIGVDGISNGEASCDISVHVGDVKGCSVAKVKQLAIFEEVRDL